MSSPSSITKINEAIKHHTLIDDGIMEHLYATKPGVLTINNKKSYSSQDIDRCLKLNFRIWKYFAGIELVDSIDDTIITFPPKSMIEKSVGVFKNGGYGFTIHYLSKRILRKLGISNSYLDCIAHDTKILNNKISAIKKLKSLGLPVPKSTTLQPKNISKLKRNLFDKKYVLKIPTAAAGMGVYVGKSGFNIDQIVNIIEKNIKIFSRFNNIQIQEFVQGDVFGSLATFKKSSYKLESIHKQNVSSGAFSGGLWQSGTDRKIKKEIDKIFSVLSSNLKLLGPISIDFIVSKNKSIKIIEVNPRLSGMSPIPYVLGLQKSMRDSLGLNKFKIKQVDIVHGIKIPNEVTKNNKFLRILKNFYKKYNVIILPQGISPNGNKSKLILINDSNLNICKKLLTCLNKYD